jgi:hypothetical protein
MATRARCNVQPAVVFLTTRVKASNEEDCKKLKQVFTYLNGMGFLRLNTDVKDLGILKWYVDGSHNVHWDCTKHLKLHRNITSCGQHVHARDAMVMVLHAM